MSLKQFSRKTATLADRLEHNVGTLKKQVGLAVGRSAIRNTPVDEGTARSNWRAKFGSRPNGVIPAHAPGQNLGRGEKINEGITLAALRARLKAAPTNTASRAPLFIVNRVEYIGDLNNGSSRQQPAGFVERAADAGRRRANKGITLKRKVNFR